jgi:hypothetical protein
MSTPWRRFGWQQMELAAPSDWYLSKVAAERAAGELWLADALMPRLQVKWLDATRQKSVDTGDTLKRYLAGIERAARRRRLDWEQERDVRLVSRGGRDVSSLEGFHFRSEMEAWGVIWYNPESLRVTLAQVNGPPDEPGLKGLARKVLGTLHDAPRGERCLWTAYDLACAVPLAFALAGQTMETGHTELNFTRGRQQETLTFARYGLAAIALERARDLGDWAWQQRWKTWHHFRLERAVTTVAGCPAVAFTGLRRSRVDRFRQRAFSYLGARYTIALSALVWHSVEANALLVVEQLRDPRDPDLVPALAEHVPCQPLLIEPPRS